MIQIKDMSKIYVMGNNTVNALNKINVHIKKHEFVAIVGPSGSGKSTFMNMIGCLDVPTAGEYFLDGSEVSKLNDNQLAEIRNLKIGFVFQRFNLLNRLSALENVELPLVYQGITGKESHRRATEALANVGLEERSFHKPSELSGGQQQRVAIARALVTKPPLILADEPTGNLDSKSGVEIIKLLKQLHSDGNTIVLITHDNKVAAEANRVIRIQDGVIVDTAEVS
jgi:putative ABC transport system ATP-binding protein